MGSLRENFSYNFKRALAASDFTHRSLADYLKISPATIQRWASGESWPPPETIEKLAELLGVSTNELLGVSEGPESRESKLGRLHGLAYQIHDLDHLIDLAKTLLEHEAKLSRNNKLENS